MSNVYILEPPTSGKVLLKTTVGDIDVELWAKETPKTCRNFIQLCLEGYYDGTIFHRIVKGFIAQGGDPNGDGTGGESIYGEPFKDEFHQRLRFTRRGLLAMANAGKDDNGSQFFFTLAATPELQNQNTIFGKITGNTLFNMLKLEEGLIENERPVYPHKILKTEVLSNPFDDIVPRVREMVDVKDKKKKKKEPGVKNFKLLSFGEEAEEDEEESSKINEKFSGKGKSTHDVLDDPKLSAQTEEAKKKKHDDNDSSDTDPEERLEIIRKKLRTEKAETKRLLASISKYAVDDDEQDERQKKRDEIKKEIENVKKEYHKNKLKKHQAKTEDDKKETEKNETLQEYKNEFDKYKDKKKSLPKKGASREQFTLDLLAKFKRKLENIKGTNDGEDEDNDDNVEDKPQPQQDNEDDAWMVHQLRFKDDAPKLAKDANMKDDDWFEIYDPRNKLNKRRRGETVEATKK